MNQARGPSLGEMMRMAMRRRRLERRFQQSRIHAHQTGRSASTGRARLAQTPDEE